MCVRCVASTRVRFISIRISRPSLLDPPGDLVMESMDWGMDVNQVKSSWVSPPAAHVKSCFSEGSPSEVRFCPHYTVSLLGTISRKWLRNRLTKTRLRVWRRRRSECQIQMGCIWLCRHLAWTQSNRTHTHTHTHTYTQTHTRPLPSFPKSTSVTEPRQDTPGQGKAQGQSSGSN